ncbi:MAG: homoserine kinase [Oscillospiraceae bacterium]|nr:homoserine kinase [Oscillospiraceae bacterium]
MHDMVTIKVPATSANLGSGFDSLGLALSLYNTVEMAENDELDIYSNDGSFVPKTDQNLIYKTVQQTFAACGKPFKSLKMGQCNPIPMARGLGSSSACIAAGVVGANELMGHPLSKDDMLALACEMEGHPDNVAPAILGGFVASVMDNKRVYTVRRNINDSICFAAFVPGFKLLTEKARAALPVEVTHKDAVFNLSRSALVAAAFCEERYELLGVATQDVLHQQYRLPLIPGGAAIIEKTREIGAIASFVSGAGPTVLAIVPTYSANSFFEKAQEMLLQDENTADFTIHKLKACNEGVQVI